MPNWVRLAARRPNPKNKISVSHLGEVQKRRGDLLTRPKSRSEVPGGEDHARGLLHNSVLPPVGGQGVLGLGDPSPSIHFRITVSHLGYLTHTVVSRNMSC